MTVKQLKTVQTLIEAMPWIRRFWGKVMVIQPDGVTARSPRLRELLAADIALLRMVGMQPVVIESEADAHGFAALIEEQGAVTVSPPPTVAAIPAELAEEKVPVVAVPANGITSPVSLAGELAAALGAEKLVLMNDAGGVCVEQPHETVIVSELSLAGVGALMAAGRVTADVEPQLIAARRALESGVTSAHIIDGRVEHALLLEVLTDAGCGTKIVV